MYSDIKSVQLLVALLKEYGIKRVVCSPGNRNVPIVHSLEQDPYFETYSVVDERSAGFFGIGLIQRHQEPVAICCTSGTAVCNYYSAVAEAYYQKLPLLVISADRNPYYLNQGEDQMLPQQAGFEKVVKMSVQLPMIKDDTDAYICGRKINEALLELDHHGKGPVHINIPLEAKLSAFTTPTLPNVKRICRHTEKENWSALAAQLHNAKVLVLYGQAAPVQDEAREVISAFAQRFDAVISADCFSNLHCEGAVSTFCLSRVLNAEEFRDNLCPDIVITLNVGHASYVKSHLKNCRQSIVHWCVNEAGMPEDTFMCLSDVFETNPVDFLQKLLRDDGHQKSESTTYRDRWQKMLHKCTGEVTDIEWSELRAMKELVTSIPANAKVHIANSTCFRLMSHFQLDPSVEVFGNRGTNGIDGSASAYMGMASNREDLCYLFIGDLSFFYDMNALWNQYVAPNMRVVLLNNHGAALFHYTVGLNAVPTLDKNIAAQHDATAKGWVESRGFRYIAVTNAEEAKLAAAIMADKTLDQPVFVEVFTDKEQDAQILRAYYQNLRKQAGLSDAGSLLKKLLRR